MTYSLEMTQDTNLAECCKSHVAKVFPGAIVRCLSFGPAKMRQRWGLLAEFWFSHV